jgi:hypothetical protein
VKFGCFFASPPAPVFGSSLWLCVTGFEGQFAQGKRDVEQFGHSTRNCRHVDAKNAGKAATHVTFCPATTTMMLDGSLSPERVSVCHSLSQNPAVQHPKSNVNHTSTGHTGIVFENSSVFNIRVVQITNKRVSGRRDAPCQTCSFAKYTDFVRLSQAAGLAFPLQQRQNVALPTVIHNNFDQWPPYSRDGYAPLGRGP